MKLDKMANSKNDEFYTPKEAITPILKHLHKEIKTIWCPFDRNESLFVFILKEHGFNVINTHIDYGQNFFDLNIECDLILSNPPYSLKQEVFTRLFSLKKPFAMLVGLAGLFESEYRFNLFSQNDFEILYFNRRIKYLKDYNGTSTRWNPPFPSVYLCHKLLPKRICFERVGAK